MYKIVKVAIQQIKHIYQRYKYTGTGVQVYRYPYKPVHS